MKASATEEVNKIFGGRIRTRVGGILIENNGILLLKHNGVGSKEYLWSPPGGGLEFGQHAKENLKREFLEETALHIEVLDLLFINEFINNKLHAIELFFEVKRISGELMLGMDPEMGNNQILSELAFFDDNRLLNTDNVYLHNMFHGINKPKEVLNLKGYFKFVNNSIK